MTTVQKFEKALRSSEITYADRVALTALDERIRSKGGATSVRAEIMTLDETADLIRKRTTVTAANGSGGGITPQWFRDVVLKPARGARIAPLFRTAAQDAPQVAVGEEGDRAEVAAPAAYGSALPESSADFTKVEVADKRFGAWARVTRGALEDSPFLDRVLRYLLETDVARSLDLDIITGDGTGEHLVGLLDASWAVPEQALGSLEPWEALVTAAGTVRASDWQGALSVVLNTADATALALGATSEKSATIDDALAALTFLGVENYVLSTVLESGTAIVGSFEEGATVYVREPVSVTVSPDDESDFLKSLEKLLVETRLGFRVHNASAFVQVTGL